MIAALGLLAPVELWRENRGVDVVVALTLTFAVFGGGAFLYAALGLKCLRAHTGLDRNEPFRIKPAIMLFTILSSLGLFMTLGLGAVLISTICFEDNWRDGVLLIGALWGGFVLLTVLLYWTKDSLLCAEKSFQLHQNCMQ